MYFTSSNAFLRLDSDSPAILDMISGPLMRKKKAPARTTPGRITGPSIVSYHISYRITRNRQGRQYGHWLGRG